MHFSGDLRVVLAARERAESVEVNRKPVDTVWRSRGIRARKE